MTIFRRVYVVLNEVFAFARDVRYSGIRYDVLYNIQILRETKQDYTDE